MQRSTSPSVPLSAAQAPRHRIWLVFSLALVGAGCGSQGNQGAAADGQVAAVVNRSELTVHQVDLLLPRVSRQPGEVAAATGRRALGSLIDQELAAQAARHEGFDREPAVIQAQQAAAREVLARAYLDRVASQAAGPDSVAVDAYFDGRPELFARRRIYTLQEFIVTGDGADRNRIPGLSRESRNVEEFEARMVSAGLKVSSNRFVRAAEDLPADVLKSLAGMAPGHALVIQGPEATRAFFVLDALAAPVDRRTAAPSIARLLAGEAQRKLVAQQIETLRQGATIDYRGAFAEAKQAVQAPAGTPGL